ncbi:MAG TPA: YeeE/YedE thiosulfate transporter family protein [Candidatus Omnitrophota bacterium]|nr:YeeE/YedE family protein [Candidatus Omnitrophota bacterium]HQO58691.1 YeeE/YedE thiosulfate transporter family protein [Candidatus Omnitrophota bacterium]HQP11749.1 YeeE/YedE thiosulfate transporter family protein [Candidatus Omnitrophota bacterium]
MLSGIIFGAGIALNGGCGLGTLRQIGEGNLMFLVVLISFIPGMGLVVFVLNPLWESGYQTQTTLLPELLGAPAVVVMGVLVLAALAGLTYLRPLKKG